MMALGDTSSGSGWGDRNRPWPISVGDLDSWSYFRKTLDQPFGMSDAEFLRRLNRLDTVGPPAIIGKAFHSVIEQIRREARRNPGVSYEIDDFVARSDGYDVEFSTLDPRTGLRLEIDIPSYTVIEQDVEMLFDTPSGWVHLRGVVDGMVGNTIIDLKTKKVSSALSDIKIGRYQDSWQWRSYLAAMGDQCRRFDYLVFACKYDTSAFASNSVCKVQIVGYHTFSCWRYPRLEQDLQGIAAELASYLEEIGWEPPAKREMDTF